MVARRAAEAEEEVLGEMPRHGWEYPLDFQCKVIVLDYSLLYWELLGEWGSSEALLEERFRLGQLAGERPAEVGEEHIRLLVQKRRGLGM